MPFYRKIRNFIPTRINAFTVLYLIYLCKRGMNNNTIVADNSPSRNPTNIMAVALPIETYATPVE
jgi:hypothetical protein